MQVKMWDPLAALPRVDREFDELIRRSLAPQVRKASFVPAIELQRDGADAIITLEVPGVDVERDVSIEIERGKLVVSGERRSVREEAEEGVLIAEMRYGSFRREFALPGHVSGEDVSASYDQGLLQVRVADVWQPEPEPVKVAIQKGRIESPRAAVSLDGQQAVGSGEEHAAAEETEAERSEA